MIHEQIKESFLKRYNRIPSLSFDNWVDEEVCSKEDFEFFKDQRKELCELAIKENSWTIQFIREQTVDLCLLALKYEEETLRYVRIVPNPDYEMTLKNLYEKKAILEAIK